MSVFEDITNKKFNRLTVIRRLIEKDIYGRKLWFCKCDCGKFISTTISLLRKGKVKSCGCLNKELQQKFKEKATKHNLRYNPYYSVWADMIQRCTNPKNGNYYKYGARGITVCDEWLTSFENFYNDMGDRPSKEYSLDRKDNNSNYEPNNCKWSTRSEQQNNKRNTVIVEYLGEKYTMVELCKKLDIDLIYFRNRYYRNFTIDEIINSYKKKG